ncbi:cilia- and flagella-associated protein 57-like [Daktulosphaira vitifoliae]|uniref:cilia- and flagella-associated protein 57-like n=1 Tax=Daktulosphaira vitifoliae TaxID=58002 RepID=UPI0021AB03BF|nr:cilia- and flagella-associated protein 57-like [Daktulosphaira vitifoliae]
MTVSQVPTLKPKFFFGLTTGVTGNCMFINKNEIVYPAAGLIIAHNFTQNSQRFLHLSEPQNTITAMDICITKNLLAVADKGEQPTVCLYDLETFKKKRVMPTPAGLVGNSFVQIKFTCDGSYLAVLSEGPDYFMYYYDWLRSKIENEMKAINPPDIVGPVFDMVPNPVDPRIMCFVGKRLFRLMMLGDLTWKQYGFQKADNFEITTACWLTKNTVLAGTVDGRLILIDDGDLKAIYTVQNLIDLDPTIKLKNPADVMSILPKDEKKVDIKCCISFDKGILFMVGNFEVYYYELKIDGRYKKRHVLTLIDNNELGQKDSLNVIETICLNIENDTVACITKLSQIYWVKFIGKEDMILKFLPLGVRLHHGCISNLSVCKWKPFFMTCGKEDRTIKMWNYLECTLIFTELFDEDVLSLSLHPTGLYCVTSFRSKVVFQLVRPKSLNIWRKFPVRDCPIVQFSSSGHMFSIINNLKVEIYCSVTFEKRFECIGHTDIITCMNWSAHDWKLYTCGSDGAIYHFNLYTGEMVLNVLQIDQKFKELTVSSDSKQIFPTASDGRIREIYNNTIIRNKEMDSFQLSGAVVLSRSDSMLFYAQKNGVILSLLLPLRSTLMYKEFQAHNSIITKIKLSIDDSVLLSTSIDGSICIWDIVDAQGMMASMNDDFAYSEELLMSSSTMKEKINYIEHLKTKEQELKRQREYTISELQKTKNKRVLELQETHSKRLEQLESLKNKRNLRFDTQKGSLEDEINKVKEFNDKEIKSLDVKYNDALMVEYEKYAKLEEKTFRVHEEIERKIKELTAIETAKLQEIKDQFDRNVAEKEKVVLQVKEDYAKEKQEIYLKIDAIEDNHERNNLERDITSIAKLKQLKKINTNLNKDLAIYIQKSKVSIKKAEDYSKLVTKYIEDIEKTKAKHKVEEELINVYQDQLKIQKDMIDKIDAAISDGKLKQSRVVKEIMILKISQNEQILMIEPLKSLMKERNEAFEGVTHELDDRSRAKSRTEFALRNQRDSIKQATRNVKIKESMVRKVYAFLRNIRIDIHYVYECSDNQVKLKESVKNLFHKYHRVQANEGSLVKEGAFAEMLRQRQFLERSLHSLRNRISVCDQKINTDKKIVEDNVTLLETVNKLREDLVVNQSKYNTLNRIIGSGDNKLLTPKQAKHLLEKVNKNVDEMRENYIDQIKKLQSKVKYLQLELIQIKSEKNL